jgi:hypothetical protein
VADLLAQSKLKNVAIAVFNKAWRVKNGHSCKRDKLVVYLIPELYVVACFLNLPFLLF